MNALVPTDDKPLVARAMDEALQPLLVLFAAYPEPYSDKNAERAKEMEQARVSAYLLGLSKLPGWAIEQAVADFIQGKIDRKKRGTLPTVEEVSAQTRVHVENEAAVQRARKARAEIFADRQPPASAEQRERMHFKMAVLSAGIARQEVDKVRQANERGLEDLMALAQSWGVPIPDSLWGARDA